MTGWVFGGWGIVEGMDFEVGRSGDWWPGTGARRAGDRPTPRPRRRGESGSDTGRGEAASGAGSAGGGGCASPRSCSSAAGLLILRRWMSHQGLAASSGRDAVRHGYGAAATVSLRQLWSYRAVYQLAVALSLDAGAGPGTSAPLRPPALPRRRWRAGAPSAAAGGKMPRELARPHAQGGCGASRTRRGQADGRCVGNHRYY
jgi:hypothetical protein